MRLFKNSKAYIK